MAEQSWTNDPIPSDASMKFKSVHFIELQDAINDWESAYSIENTSFTDSPTVREKINATAMTEMQDALDDLLQLADSNNFSWTERPIIRTKIKAIHVNEVRDNMNTMQNDYCYQCDSCDAYTGCVCNTGCYNDACDRCYTSCHAVDCTDKFLPECNLCYFSCYQDACDLCNNACYTNNCSGCHVSNYRYPW